MKPAILVIALTLAAALAFGQRDKLVESQQAHLKAADFDKAIEAGEKLLALDPLDYDAAYQNLKAAEGKKDADAILKWAVATSEGARKNAALPKKTEQSEEDYQHAVKAAKETDIYAEYALSAASLTEPDAAKSVRLIEALEQRNPQSQYFAMTLPKYIFSARQANLLPAAIAFGERAFARGTFNEDLLLTMADYHMQQVKDPQKVVLYSQKTVEVITAKAKPEGVSDADWTKKKESTLGLANWMAGTTLASQNKYAEADKVLRAALPYIKENAQLNGTALFYLGLGNYQTGKALVGKGQGPQMLADALQFMQQSAAIPGPLQTRAQGNLTVMRREIGPPRKK